MLCFWDFTLDPTTGELRQKGLVVPLEPQPARVLVLLSSKPGALVTRDELRAAIWGEGTHVEFDQGLNYCIRQVRAVLGDDARKPLFIETVARRGYRFLPPVRPIVPIKRRRVFKVAVAVAGFAAAFWVAEQLEGPGGGRAHHDAAVGILKTLHDLIF